MVGITLSGVPGQTIVRSDRDCGEVTYSRTCGMPWYLDTDLARMSQFRKWSTLLSQSKKMINLVSRVIGREFGGVGLELVSQSRPVICHDENTNLMTLIELQLGDLFFYSSSCLSVCLYV